MYFFKYITTFLVIGNMTIIISCNSSSKLNTQEKESEVLLYKQENYQFTGLVLEKKLDSSQTNKQIEIIKVQVTSSINKNLEPNTIVFCERIKDNNSLPITNREYVFKGKNSYKTKDNKQYIQEIVVQDLIN